MDSSGDDRNDFRKSKIYPTVADINRQNVPNLWPNLVGQSYDSADHYFKTQFSLLREESVRPLVDAVNKLRQLLAEEKGNKNKGFSSKINNNIGNRDNEKEMFREKVDKEVEGNVYYDIKLAKPYVDFDMNYGSVLKFTFDYKPIEKIDLVDCQHLMNGGILCLSADNFDKSIVFGVIVKSQLREVDHKSKERLWNFCLKLDFDGNKPKFFNEFLLKPKASYLGIESPSFFEGFRYSLQRLQSMSKDFPFSPYILGSAQSINNAPYLTQDSIYDMSCVTLQKPDLIPGTEPKVNPLSSVELMKNDLFGQKKAFDKGVDQLKKCSTFDTKQFDAFYAALTKELCVIEGPPGTGKTFVGLKIVECLLKNSNVWNPGSEIRPILIVCYKNHALDQFLEGIVRFNNKVVRIGGNCESKELQEYRLRRVEDQFREDLEEQRQLKDKINTKEEEEDIKEGVKEDIKEDIKEGVKEYVKDMTNGIKLLDPKLVSAYRKRQKLRARVMRLSDQIRGLSHKIEDSFTRVLDSKHLTPFIKPKSLSDYFSKRPDSLKKWLNSEEEEEEYFSNVCQSRLNRKRLPLEAFDDITSLVKTLKRNVLELNAAERWLLYFFWREQLFKSIQKELNVKFKTIEEEIQKFKEKDAKFRQMLCKGSQVIGLTITGAAKYADLVQALNPKIMIVEEAAEVLEGHIVAALSSTVEHLILIGDHKQLRPLTNVQELTDTYKMDISLFERLVKNGLPFIQLELQHRMRPTISELLKVGNIYDNLRNDEKVRNYPNVEYTFGKNLFFLDHQHIEDNNICRDIQDKSRSNMHEAKLVVELVKYFLLRNYPEDKITVLATYNAQLSLIKKLMFDDKSVFVKVVAVDKSSKIFSNKKPTEESNGVTQPSAPETVEELRVRVSSVDGFQGEENEIIIISFVRSSKRNAIGFLDNKNRVNVALSRAKHALYCIGNFTIMAKEEKTQMWSQIIKHLSERECFSEEFTIGCKCTEEQYISMPYQLSVLNHQLRNGRCKCMKQN